MPKIKYQDIKMGQARLDLVATCNRIIAEYVAQGYTLTLRQLYYQMVARDVIPNRTQAYNNLGSLVNDARLAGLIDWSALEDRTRKVKSVNHWDSPEEIVEAVANQYRIDKWEDQPIRPEVWVEKDALVGVVQRICTELDVSYLSCRGYTSQSEMWGAAQRFVKNAKNRQVTHIIHLGDHDPSGIDMSRDIETRIRMFMEYHGCKFRDFKFTRIALNMDQVKQYNPPPNPAKATDSRFQGYQDLHGNESWELDALEPRVLSDLIRAQVDSIRDDNLYKQREEEEERQKSQLAGVSQRWDDVVEFLEV